MIHGSIYKFLLALSTATLIITACAPTPEMTAEIPVTGDDNFQNNDTLAVESAADVVMAETLLMPVMDVPAPERTLKDSDSSLRANEKRVLSGDNFLKNLYERPFTSGDMIYQPDIDIRTVDFAQDDQFFYFTITLGGMNPDDWGLNGIYGIEFDRTLTGRGDLFVRTTAPAGTDWSADTVLILTDTKGDVGGPRPLIPDTGFNGSGYDGTQELAGDQSAMARIDPSNPLAIQIAVSRALLDNPEQFTWGAWADNGLRDFGLYDYHDNFGLSAAGSPFRDNPDYPIGAVYSVDNTCRLPYGSAQMGSTIPGVCVTLPPVEENKDDKPIVCEPPYYLINGECQYFG